MSAIKGRFKAVLFKAGVFALVLGPVLGTPANAAPTQAQAGQVARKDTLIVPGNVNIPAPDIWNPYIPGTFILQGMNQNLMEPLFMLNYETGNIDGWLAESYTNSPDMTQWTVKLRPGTEWSDGQPLTSDDVVRRAHYRNAQRPFDRLLSLGIVPIVNENDTVATDEIRFGDNDRLAALVTHLVRADALFRCRSISGRARIR